MRQEYGFAGFRLKPEKVLFAIVVACFVLGYLNLVSGRALTAYCMIFTSSLIILLKGADFLVEGASSLASHYGISPVIIGLTVVAFGTSLPEFVVSLYANMVGSVGISIGNIVGSNIANVGLILGVTGLVAVIQVRKVVLSFDALFMILAAVVLFALSFNFLDFSDSPYVLGRIDGLILLSLFCFFMWRMARDARRQHADYERKHHKKSADLRKDFLVVAAGLAGVIVGAELLVESGRNIAVIFGVPEVVIGLTIIAVGTSLPELATNIMAVMKRKHEIAIGNIVGSNIFNILFVLGVTATLMPMQGIRAATVWIYMPVMIFFSALVVLFMGRGLKLDRKRGAALLLMYMIYLAYLFTYSGY
jgi:cation:H+ antiporter